MPRKKQSKVKKSKKATPINDIDINDIDSMFEDMKKLVMKSESDEKQEVEEENAESVLQEETVTVIPFEEGNDTFTVSSAEITTVTEDKTEDKVEVIEADIENHDIVADEETMDFHDIDVIGDVTDDEVKKEEAVNIEEETVEKKVEEPNKENKPKRKTYQEMFGHTWMGYGFSD